MIDEFGPVLAAIGPRLRALRKREGDTLAAAAERTGISVSTLSRLESGVRTPTLALLLPLARAYRVALDDLVDPPLTGDPRLRPHPITRHGMTAIPLTTGQAELRAFKSLLPAGPVGGDPGSPFAPGVPLTLRAQRPPARGARPPAISRWQAGKRSSSTPACRTGSATPSRRSSSSSACSAPPGNGSSSKYARRTSPTS
ncbi:helix-turn-helix transcriptional regulator [Amycolatopsis sp. QT-25]|uniref:helix-turn-helix domain-containing protein n=1 Tax=Amycolatopsis sp. QT-25 TaxID=3034022 RepID=UPI003207E779